MKVYNYEAVRSARDIMKQRGISLRQVFTDKIGPRYYPNMNHRIYHKNDFTAGDLLQAFEACPEFRTVLDGVQEKFESGVFDGDSLQPLSDQLIERIATESNVPLAERLDAMKQQMDEMLLKLNQIINSTQK